MITIRELIPKAFVKDCIFCFLTRLNLRINLFTQKGSHPFPTTPHFESEE